MIYSGDHKIVPYIVWCLLDTVQVSDLVRICPIDLTQPYEISDRVSRLSIAHRVVRVRLLSISIDTASDADGHGW